MKRTRAVALGILGLAACASPAAPGDDVYRAQAVATLTSLDCSRREASGLGYRVAWLDGPQEGTLRAERRFDENSTRPTRGTITVTVSHDPGDVMLVTAERFLDNARMPGPPTAPRPTPTPTPVPPARRTGLERISPGEVARDAHSVLRRCGMGEISERRA